MIFADIFVRVLLLIEHLRKQLDHKYMDSLFQVHHTTLHCVKHQICMKVNDDSQDNR